LKAGAVTLRGLNVFHFIIFRHKLLYFAVAAADCLLDREESSKKRMKKDLPQSPKSKSRKSQG
jgi:hypothetical protein